MNANKKKVTEQHLKYARHDCVNHVITDGPARVTVAMIILVPLHVAWLLVL